MSLRNGTSPVPSKFGCRVCNATQSAARNRSSNTSSQLITRSREGMAEARQLSNVIYSNRHRSSGWGPVGP